MTYCRLIAAALFTACGWCAGDTHCRKAASRRAALEATIQLLERIQQEINYRLSDLGRLYKTLQQEAMPGSVIAEQLTRADCFQKMEPPPCFNMEEAACFGECMRGLGRTAAVQECARLDYYIQRFNVFLQRAQQAEQTCAGLDRRLGLAAGAMLGLALL